MLFRSMDRYAVFARLAQFLEIMLYVLVAGVMWGTWLSLGRTMRSHHRRPDRHRHPPPGSSRPGPAVQADTSPGLAGAPGTPRTHLARQPVPSTGPYQVAQFIPGRRLLPVRNRRFREWSRAAQPDGYPDRIDIRMDATPATGSRPS